MPESSEKSRGVALALAAVLGPFGAHRFYAGRTESGIAMAVTLGGLGVWWLYDLIVTAAGSLRDAEGRRISRWDPEERDERYVPDEVLDELDRLRAEVAELAERVDFTERLLGSGRREDIEATRDIRPG